MPAELSGEGPHRFRPRTHHPRAQCLEPGLRPRAAGAVGVDVLQAFAHSARPGGLRPPLHQIALDLQPRVREVGLVPGPQALRPFRQAVSPALRLAHLVDGLVGVLDHMEPVNDFGGVGEPLADALGKSQAHVARHAPGTPPRDSGTASPSGSRSRCAARVCRPSRRGIPPRHHPRVGQLQGGSEQRSGIHTTKLPERPHLRSSFTHPKQRKAIKFLKSIIKNPFITALSR